MTPTTVPHVRLYVMSVDRRCEHKGCERRPRYVIILVNADVHQLQMSYVCKGHVDEDKTRIKVELERLGYNNPKDAS